MPHKCSVLKCDSQSGGNTTLFKVPKDPQLAQKWSEFLSKGGQNMEKKKEFKICEKHFQPRMILSNSERRLLQSGSCPSIYNISEVSKQML